MRMATIKHLLPFGLIILLSSCATTTSNYYQQTIAGWKGGNVHDLIKRWGTPDVKSMSPKGEMVLVYRTQNYKSYNSGVNQPAFGVNFGKDGRPILITTQNTNNSLGQNALSCAAMFIVNRGGMITHTEVKGQGCYGSDNFAATMSNPNVKTTDRIQ